MEQKSSLTTAAQNIMISRHGQRCHDFSEHVVAGEDNEASHFNAAWFPSPIICPILLKSQLYCFYPTRFPTEVHLKSMGILTLCYSTCNTDSSIRYVYFILHHKK